MVRIPSYNGMSIFCNIDLAGRTGNVWVSSRFEGTKPTADDSNGGTEASERMRLDTGNGDECANTLCAPSMSADCVSWTCGQADVAHTI